MNIVYKVGPLMLKLSVVLMAYTISYEYWYVEGDVSESKKVKALFSCHLSDCSNITSYLLHFSKHRGGFRVSDLLNSKEHICIFEWLSICTTPFPVPNHSKNDMNQKVPHLRLQLYTGNYSREFYEMDYLSKLHYKYPKLLSYMNRQMFLDSRKIPKDIKRKLFRDDKKTHLSLEAILYGEMLSLDISEKSRNYQDKSVNTNRFGSFSSRSQNYKRLRDQKLNSKTMGESRHLRTRRRVKENEGNSEDVHVKVRFKLEKAVTAKEVNDEFRRHLKSQLAKRMRVPIPSIKDMEIQSGTDVSFTLSTFNDANNAMDEQTVFEAADFLEKEIKDHKLRLTDMNGHLLVTSSKDDNPMNFSLVILIVLGVTLLMIVALIIVLVYLAKRLSRIPKASSDDRNRAYRNMDFGRDSSQSVGKYSYDSGLWLGPGPEPSFTVPEAPYYRPPTADQIASTPRPITAVRTRLKTNWNVDERALSTIPDDHGRPYATGENNYH